jgi:predicted XRE-type DNA-binding protein
MSASNKEVLELVKTAKKNLKHLTHITSKVELTSEDKLKISLCKHFVRYMNENELSLTQLSVDLELPKSRVSEIVNYKIRTFTIDKIVQNLGRLALISPKTREYLIFIEEAFELPLMNVSETRQLTKHIKDIGKKVSKTSFSYL